MLKGKHEDATWAKPEYQNRSGSRISECGIGFPDQEKHTTGIRKFSNHFYFFVCLFIFKIAFIFQMLIVCITRKIT